MGFKEYVSQIALSDRRRRAVRRLHMQIDAGVVLGKRIENLIGKEQASIPRDQWVPYTEVTGWQNSGRALVAELFGASSSALRDWDRIWDAEPPSSAYDKHPESVYLNRIGQVNGYLEGLKTHPALSGNAIDKTRDWIAQHPVLGPIIAGCAILGLVFSVWRGVSAMVGAIGQYFVSY